MPVSAQIVKGQGTSIAYSLAVPAGAYTTLERSKNIAGPTMTVPVVPTTDLSSTAVTKRGGLPDYGQVTFEQWFDSKATTSTDMLGLMASGNLASWQITYANGATCSFTGILSSYEPDGSTTDNTNLEVKATIDISGAVTYA